MQASDLEMEMNSFSLEGAKEMKKLMKSIDNLFIPSLKETANKAGINLNSEN